MFKALFFLPKVILAFLGWLALTLTAAFSGAALLAGVLQPIVSFLGDAAQHLPFLKGAAAVPANVWAAGIGTGIVWWLYTRVFVVGLPHLPRRQSDE